MTFWSLIWRLVAYGIGDDWDTGDGLDLRKGSPTRTLIAQGIRAERRERGARIVRRFSRDPIVERRERLIEQRAAAARPRLRMVK